MQCPEHAVGIRYKRNERKVARHVHLGNTSGDGLSCQTGQGAVLWQCQRHSGKLRAFHIAPLSHPSEMSEIRLKQLPPAQCSQQGLPSYRAARRAVPASCLDTHLNSSEPVVDWVQEPWAPHPLRRRLCRRRHRLGVIGREEQPLGRLRMLQLLPQVVLEPRPVGALAAAQKLPCGGVRAGEEGVGGVGCGGR